MLDDCVETNTHQHLDEALSSNFNIFFTSELE
jgi:hypothetical protein